MGGHSTTSTKRRRHLKKSLSPRLEKLEEDFEKAGGGYVAYKISKLFNVVSGSQPPIHNRYSEKRDGMVNTITGATTRNGINFYSYSEQSYNHELTISKDGEYAGTVFLQTEPFIVGGHCMGIFTNENYKTMSDESKIYIAALINKVRPMWSGNDRPSVQKSRLENLEIILPSRNGEIEFSHMEEYIKTLEAERIETLEAYLTVTGLKDYHLTEKDEQILDRFAKLNDTQSRAEQSRAEQSSIE